MIIMRVFLLSLLICMLGAAPVVAQTPDVPATCDADFHNLLRTKAWMEAQREIEVAETLILDPAKVLEYTCFKDYADYFATKTVFGNEDDRKTEYTYAGGPPAMTDATSPSTKDPALLGFIDSFASGLSLGCTTMKSIWDDVRCDDVDKGKYFKDFDGLVSSDPRSCSNSTRDDNWEEADELFFPDDFREVDDGGTDKLDTFLKKMDPTNCGASAVVKTGVIIKVGGETVTTDSACLAPGCYFNGTSCQ